MRLVGHARRRGRSGVSVGVEAGQWDFSLHRAPSRRRGWGAAGWGQRLVLRHGVNAAVRIWRLGRELAVIWL